MKSYYQPKGGKKGNYALRENTYRRTWYLIADYPYFKEMQANEEEQMHGAKAGASTGEAGSYAGVAVQQRGSMLREGAFSATKCRGARSNTGITYQQ